MIINLHNFQPQMSFSTICTNEIACYQYEASSIELLTELTVHQHHKAKRVLNPH